MIYVLRFLDSDGNFYLPDQPFMQSIADCLEEFHDYDWFVYRLGRNISPDHLVFLDGNGKNVSEDVAELFIEKYDGDLDDLPEWVDHHAARAIRIAREEQSEIDVYGTMQDQASADFRSTR